MATVCFRSTIMLLNGVDFDSHLGGFYDNLSATKIWFQIFTMYRANYEPFV